MVGMSSCVIRLWVAVAVVVAVSCGTRLLDLWPIDKGFYFKNYNCNMKMECVLFVLLQCLGPLDQFQHSMEPQLRQLGLDTTLKKGTCNFSVLCQNTYFIALKVAAWTITVICKLEAVIQSCTF